MENKMLSNTLFTIFSLVFPSLSLALTNPTNIITYKIYEGDKLLISPKVMLLTGEAIFISNSGVRVFEVGTKLSEKNGDNKSHYLSSTLTVDGIKVASIEKNISVNSTFTFEDYQYKMVAEFKQTK
jgi:hypothetical protein